MNIKSSLNQSVLEDFRACDGWLDQWKLHHGIRKKLISGESLVVSKTTMESWMEIIKELCTGYDCQNIWNMDNSGCFFKVLPSKRKAKKGKKTKVSREWLSVSSLVLVVRKLENQLPFGKAKSLDVFVKQIPLQKVTKSLIFKTQKHGCK